MNGMSGCSARCSASSTSSERAARAALRRVAKRFGLQHRLGQLEVPVAELVPRELVERRGGEIEAVLAQGRFDLLQHLAEARADPAVRDRQLRGAASTGAVRRRVIDDEARGIPQLVAEVAVARDAAEIEADVAARRGERREGEAQRVRAVRRRCPSGIACARRLLDGRRELRLHQAAGALGDQRLELDAVHDVERVDDVALGLRHLVAVLVADEAGDVDLAERHVAHELQAHHHHARDPEEDDVEARDRARCVG